MVVGLVGDLGMGKTCFIKGLASALSGVAENDVTSPTFTFMQAFTGTIPLYHFDLYRIQRTADLRDLGFDECLYGDGVTVIEWADRAADALPQDRLIVHIDFISETSRRFTFSARGTKHTAVLDTFKRQWGGGE
jgi:tRNA threonylcarbamoyladenosine biosynthesis protein TsaE